MRAMSRLQPEMQALQAKYPNDKARVQQETLKLYKEHGVNPLGCLGPLVLQMPIFFGLFMVPQRHPAVHPRKASRSGREAVLLAPDGPPGGAAGRHIPVDGPREVLQRQPHSDAPAYPGRRLDVRHAEDDPHGGNVCPAAVDEPDDAVAHAVDVRFLHAELRGWTRAVLDRLKHRWHSNSGLHHWVGTARLAGKLPASAGAGCDDRVGPPGWGADSRGGRNR